MDQVKTFDLITKSFSNVFNKFSYLNITKELDWERHLYIELKKNIGVQYFKRYLIMLEMGAFKHGKGILWISPNKYEKKKNLIDEYFNIEQDEGGHYKIKLNENLKPLKSPINKFIKTEKERKYYTDIIIYDKNVGHALAYIELKMGTNLTKEKVLEDFYKLRRLELVRDFPAIYIAAGFDPSSNHVYWIPNKKSYNYSFDIYDSYSPYHIKNFPQKFINKDRVCTIIKESSKNLYENMHATEAVWVSEIMSVLEKFLPTEWKISGEVSDPLNRKERIDIGILDNLRNLRVAIELKNHFESPFPKEILNGLNTDKNLLKDFLKKTDSFLAEYNLNKEIIKKRSAFPKLGNKDYLNPDFFEKIIEMYSQVKRMSELISSNELDQGFMIYIDHNDDYSIRKNTHSISEEVFLENFHFRKHLIEKILESIKSENCQFIYMFKLNGKDDSKRLFFTRE